jgi:hypothetical protein
MMLLLIGRRRVELVLDVVGKGRYVLGLISALLAFLYEASSCLGGFGSECHRLVRLPGYGDDLRVRLA